jgi:hypothetical protein
MSEDGKNLLTTIKPLEYYVLYQPDRKRWEVHYADMEIGHKAWDKRVATSFAKAEAKKHRPSVVLICKKGTSEVQQRIEFGAQA